MVDGRTSHRLSRPVELVLRVTDVLCARPLHGMEKEGISLQEAGDEQLQYFPRWEAALFG